MWCIAGVVTRECGSQRMQHASPNKGLCTGICYNLTRVRHRTRRTGPSDKQQAVTGQSAARKHLPAPACHRQRPLHVLAAAANADKAPCAGFSGNMQGMPPNPQLSMPSAQAALTRSPTTTAGSAASCHLALGVSVPAGAASPSGQSGLTRHKVTPCGGARLLLQLVRVVRRRQHSARRGCKVVLAHRLRCQRVWPRRAVLKRPIAAACCASTRCCCCCWPAAALRCSGCCTAPAPAAGCRTCAGLHSGGELFEDGAMLGAGPLDGGGIARICLPTALLCIAAHHEFHLVRLQEPAADEPYTQQAGGVHTSGCVRLRRRVWNMRGGGWWWV